MHRRSATARAGRRIDAHATGAEPGGSRWWTGDRVMPGTRGNVLTYRPPPTIRREEVDRGIGVLDDILTTIEEG